MAETKVSVPMMLNGKPLKKFQCNTYDGLEKALAECLEAGYDPLFIPQIVDTRIRYCIIRERTKDDIWNDSYWNNACSPVTRTGSKVNTVIVYNEVGRNSYTTPSVCVTGRTKGGKAVVVYAHVPNYFSDPANITVARKAGLVRGTAKMPLKKFYQLLEMEDGKNVFVVDYYLLRASHSGIVQVVDAMKHPLTIPFLGGKERAEKYLAKHIPFYGDTIAIRHRDDLTDSPQARMLQLGDLGSNGLLGSTDIDGIGCFLGEQRSYTK